MKRERREDAIRSSLLTRMKEAVQSVVQPGGSANRYSQQHTVSPSGVVAAGPVLGHSDNTNALCNILEGVFIHGLRDSLGERMSSFLGSDPDRMPVPNFWPVLLVISHRDIIEQVNELSFISSEVGRSRAWVRLALNTGQICSYLSVLIKDSHILKDYYKPTSFLRDYERSDMMVSILQPVSSITFCLATNAAVLNTWTQTPLVLAGLWAPMLEQHVASDPILAATDVASTVRDDSDPSGNTDVNNIPSSPVTDQMFEFIIGGTPETSFIRDYMDTHNNTTTTTTATNTEDTNEDVKERRHTNTEGMKDGRYTKEKMKEGKYTHTEDMKEGRHTMSEGTKEGGGGYTKNTEGMEEDGRKQPLESTPSGHLKSPSQDQNRGTVTKDYSSDIINTLDFRVSSIESQLETSHNTNTSSTTSKNSYLRECSVDSMSNSMIEGSSDYTRIFSDNVPTDGFSIIMPVGLGGAFSPTSPDPSTTPSVEVSNESSPSEVAERLNYEVLPRELPSDEDMNRLLPLLTRLTNEKGLDSQLYKCYQCKAYIGMIYGKPRICSYDSKYYCYECHQDEGSVVPARIVHNWDFTSYPVCCSNSVWLSAIYHRPLIDLRTVNARLYCHVEDLAELQVLRTQLLYVRAYLFTCRSGVGEKLNRMLWPREHLYEHVHLYSLADLQLVAAGQLVPQVRQAVTFGRDHIVKCEVCSARGFFCELCDDSNVIYPFQLGDTYTCGECYGVYHSVCSRRLGPCPRCVRRAARREKNTQ
ncbi:hypothetical protein Pcinc_001238 [Petrolisthes cinctipes]|uniref:RUN domain-containing protein n=1 Tax=Petrolisthes cinctipes TaxID=88211 RepID=A0AAE1L633_PETCI|nr:hypothetical protein Pcinc_001238 [Petrolisthes cinctipes]